MVPQSPKRPLTLSQERELSRFLALTRQRLSELELFMLTSEARR